LCAAPRRLENVKWTPLLHEWALEELRCVSDRPAVRSAAARCCAGKSRSGV